MEKSKEVNTNEKPIDEKVKKDWGGGGCSFWFFGNENSADNDLKDKFEVIDDETKD